MPDLVTSAEAMAHPGLRWLDRDPRPRFVLTARGAVTWQNAAATSQLTAPLPLRLAAGRMSLDDANAALELARFSETRDEPRTSIPVIDEDDRPAAILNCSVDHHKGERLICVTVGLIHVRAASGVDICAENYGLTRAESQILMAICEFEQPQQIADRLGLSVHTVRTHLQHIYNKAGVRSQAKLITLCLAFEPR